MKTLTSMSRFRFDELRQGILDGSLAAKWRRLEDLPKESLTKSQRMEFRQIAAITSIFEEDPKVLTRLVKRTWRELRIIKRNDRIFAEVTE